VRQPPRQRLPSCSSGTGATAYQIFQTMVVVGRSVPETVASHSAVFPTFAAPSFGPVHARIVDRHLHRPPLL
jgi:hypothetical protein